MLAAANRFVPGLAAAVIDHDMFTPVTVRRFTGHDAGAIYGIPDRQYDHHPARKPLPLRHRPGPGGDRRRHHQRDHDGQQARVGK